MIRVVRSLEVFQVTGHAGRGCQAVVVVDMAVQADARRIGMGIRQRKADARVIKFGV